MANLTHPRPERTDDPLDQPRAAGRRRHVRLRHIVGAFVVTLALLSAATVLAYQQAYADRVYLGVVTEDGLDLGSLTRQEASQALVAHFADSLERELRIRYGDREWVIPAADLGLRFELERALDSAYRVGRQGGPFQRLVDQYTALLSRQAVIIPRPAVDEGEVARRVATLVEEIDRPVVDARLVIDGELRVSITPSQLGRQLIAPSATAMLFDALSSGSSREVTLPVKETPPAVTEADLTPAKAAADKMLSSDLRLRFDDRTWTLSRSDIAGMIVRDGSDNSVPRRPITLDDAKLTAFAGRLQKDVDRDPVKPRLRFDGGSLEVIREGQSGYRLDVPATAGLIKKMAAGDERDASLPVKVTLPPGMAEDRAAIKELVASATTDYSGSFADRLFNVELAAAKINGTVVGPGETFSFNKEIGPMTLEAGFKWGWGIGRSQGQLVTVPSVAGGICQVSTTLFQSVFWGGYNIVDRKGHSYWIPRYGTPPRGMQGLDATVDQVYDANGKLIYTVDFKFENTSPYPLLIEAKTDGARLTFNLYSTKPAWEVTVAKPVISDVVPADPTLVREVEPSLAPGQRIVVEAAHDGFTSTIVRTVAESGKQPKVFELVSLYKPSRNVVMVGPPSAQ